VWQALRPLRGGRRCATKRPLLDGTAALQRPRLGRCAWNARSPCPVPMRCTIRELLIGQLQKGSAFLTTPCILREVYTNV